MNTLTNKLSQQLTLQSFLIKTIEYIEKYFETINLQSEQKTYASINKICSKIQSKFNDKYALESLAKKLCLNVETKINDKQQDVQSCSKQNNNKKKTFSGMKSFLTNIESAIEIQTIQVMSPELAPIEPPTRLPSTESQFSWIRKTVLEQLELLKDDILDADDKMNGFIEQALGKNLGDQRYVLIFESFLDNKFIIEKIRALGWAPIFVRNQKKPPSKCGKETGKEALEGGKKQQQAKQQKEEVKEIMINDLSSYLHRCHSIIISTDCITKTGGVVSASGSLMLCLMGRRRRVPVIMVSRNYCLGERTLLSQKSLTSDINPSEYFKINHDDFGLYITKNEDFIEAKYIDLMITQRGSWMVGDISQVQDQYWSY